MVASSLDRTSNPIRSLLGLGFWVQGFRCFPWMAVNFFLKDSLNVDPSTLQLLQNSANLPMVGKPLYGVVSDAVYISGQHRVPYIAIGGKLKSLNETLFLQFHFLSFVFVNSNFVLLGFSCDSELWIVMSVHEVSGVLLLLKLNNILEYK